MQEGARTWIAAARPTSSPSLCLSFPVCERRHFPLRICISTSSHRKSSYHPILHADMSKVTWLIRCPATGRQEPPASSRVSGGTITGLPGRAKEGTRVCPQWQGSGRRGTDVPQRTLATILLEATESGTCSSPCGQSQNSEDWGRLGREERAAKPPEPVLQERKCTGSLWASRSGTSPRPGSRAAQPGPRCSLCWLPV